MVKSCIDCGADSSQGTIYIHWKNGKKAYRCIDCMLNDELSSVPFSCELADFLYEYRDEFQDWLEEHVSVYGDYEEDNE